MKLIARKKCRVFVFKFIYTFKYDHKISKNIIMKICQLSRQHCAAHKIKTHQSTVQNID